MRTPREDTLAAGPRPNTLLLVDDEPHICASLRRILHKDGYEVLTATSAAEALAVLAQRHVDVVVSDQRMPGRFGTDLLNEVMQRYPDTIRLILSGAADVQDIVSAMKTGAIYKFLTKPIDPALLRANVAEAFTRAAWTRDSSAVAAARDSTTGLATRDYVRRIFPGLVAAAEADGRAVCVVMIRFDQYSQLTASFGRTFGEGLQREAAQALTGKLGSTCFVAADAPGDFLVIADDDDPSRRIVSIESVLAELFGGVMVVQGQTVAATVTVGATIGRQGNCRFDALVDEAHAALVAAADGTSDKLQLYDPRLIDARRDKLQLEADVRRSVGSGDFHLVYQPQVHIVTGEIVGLEALVRWTHPERGLISPMSFIPMVEELGLIDELGAWILDAAVEQFSRWRASGVAPPELAVNVSPLQLREPEVFLAHLKALLQRTQLPASGLVLELTESAAIASDGPVAECLIALRDVGVTLAVDDFGTGYANLSNLTRIAFKKLKIDRSLLPGEGDERSRRLFSSVVAMAKELGLTVVAEGVETPHELASVGAARCEVVQGYFYSPPVSPERLERLLASRFPER